LACVSLTDPRLEKLTALVGFFPKYCFDRTVPLLRRASLGSIGTVYNHIVSLQGRYVAREVRQAIGGKASFDLSLDVVEGIEVADTFPTIPSDAKPIDLTAISLPDVAGFGTLPLLRSAGPRDYPEAAMARRVQGTVVLEATIEKDGHVDNISMVSGPVELRQASIDAVAQRLYEPLEVLGEARAVKVQIRMIFALG